MNDERLRDLYRQGIAARAARSAGRPASAVSPEELLALARAELPEERRLELLDRVMSDDRSREGLDLLRAVVAAEPRAAVDGAGVGDGPAGAERPVLRVVRGGGGRTAAPESAPARRWWRRGGVPAALAAALVLAVGINQFRGVQGDERVTRGAEDGVVLLAPAQSVDGTAGLAFVWRPVAGASRYALEVVDGGGDVVFETTTTDTTAALPAGVALRQGAEYHWIVRAVDDAGGERGRGVRRLEAGRP